MFKQESKYHEHFYGLLKPWIHYIPVQHDLSDLVERIRWAHDNDEKAQQIALAGQKFAMDNLLPKDIFCFHGRLFQVKLFLNQTNAHQSLFVPALCLCAALIHILSMPGMGQKTH